MKKMLFFVIVAMFFFSNSAEAFDTNRFLHFNKEIISTFSQMKADPSFRDFDFQLLMTIVHIKSMNQAIKAASTKQKKQATAQAFAVVLKCDYISMETYLKKYVIAKSPNPNAQQKKCQKLLDLIQQASTALHN